MKPPPPMVRLVLAVVLIAGVGVAAFLLWPRAEAPGLTGYVEGESLYLAAPASGALSRLAVERGQRVEAGALLFEIDPRTAMAQVDQAGAAAEAARDRAADALKGQRPEELAVYRAQRRSAEAVLAQAEADYRRIETLTRQGVYAQARLDQARAARDAARAQHEEALRRLEAAELGARRDQAAAAAAEARAAEAGRREAGVRASLMTQTAPLAGRIEDVFFRPGEWTPASSPVVALLPDDRVKVRLFVPETEVPLWRPGARLTVRCDGCRPQTARVVYVSSRPEFSPPVIYSRGNRERLVFLVEASPEAPRELAPGQPVDVELIR